MTTTELPVIFLNGERLYLRPVEKSDLQRCQRWINDAETNRWLSTQFPASMLAQEQWFESSVPTGVPTKFILAIVLKENDRHIGNIGLHDVNWKDRRGNTGMLIGEPDCRGQGYGPEAKELLLEYAFNVLGLHRIGACALATNKRSIRSLKKSGYKKEGRFREDRFRNGVWVDEILFSILDHEWRALRTAKQK